jgi:hypothetical protein
MIGLLTGFLNGDGAGPVEEMHVVFWLLSQRDRSNPHCYRV